ncbi:tetratricopeptide repeat protein [Parvularcula sp. IMCC14364]|uniref:tetratricopeptide repeat protein n=1 Tax=Parvularcula sp. IMCC14364 TaxID=3067902 RepID=UPI00274049BC|nr:tetratricopeptide repeat protein [Parvularcula sp. IMCC14364]
MRIAGASGHIDIRVRRVARAAEESAVLTLLNRLVARPSFIAIVAATLLTSSCTSGVGSYDLAAFDNSSAAGQYLKARYAASQQQVGLAAEAYSSAAAFAPQDTSLLQRTFFYELAAGNISDATPYAEKLLLPEFQSADATLDQSAGMLPGLAKPEFTVAAELIRSGDYEAAQALLSEDFDGRAASTLAYLVNAWMVYETEGLDAGLAAMNPSGRADIYPSFTPLHQAMMLDLGGREEEAEAAYQLALSAISPQSAIVAYADFLGRGAATGENTREQALSLYRKLSEDTGLLRRAGRLGLARLGEPLARESRTTRQLENTKIPRAVNNGREGAALAFYSFAWGSYEQIISQQNAAQRAGFNNMQAALNTPLAFAQLAAYLNLDLDEAHYVIGAIFTSYEQPEQAIEAFEKIDFDNPFYEFAQMDIADAWILLGENDRALSSLQDFTGKDTLTPDARSKVASLLTDAGADEEADAAQTEAIRIAEQLTSSESERFSLWRYYFARGATRIEAGRWADGEADLKKAVELSPDQPYVLNFLGYSWAERGENLDAAFDMIEKALSLEPTSGAITDSLGWAHYQRGNYAEAVKHLERAVTLEPSDAVITDHLGDAYWQTGRPVEARYEWRRALSLDPDTDLQAAIERKLADEVVSPAASIAAGSAR